MSVYQLEDLRPSLPQPGSYWIADNAVVAGMVHLAAGVSIWFGAILRAEDEWITVGEGSNIQDGCVIHVDPGFPTTIGRNCTIGHRAVIHGCVIGDNTLVGMSATLMNGARVGANCLIGAGCLVTEGKVIPDGSLVMGAPCKVVRHLEPSEIEWLPRTAERYVARQQRYARGLTPVFA